MTALSVATHRQLNSLSHAEVLLARASVTPNDGGCQAYLIHRLQKLGFVCQQHQVEGVTNLIARWGQGSHHFAFCGHTDVVPPGPLQAWKTDPFSPVVYNNTLFGRGAADMKTAIAAMLAASERILKGANPHTMSYWWLITSDEEGEAEYGSRWIKEYLDSLNIRLDLCLVGEPTASSQTGDTIKVGRRGSLSGTVLVSGKQGHVAYPHSCDNAIHRASAVLNALLGCQWDAGTPDFPGTSVQITHVDTGRYVDNLAPGQCRIEFNVRYSHLYTQDSLMARLSDCIYTVQPDARVTWSRACESYLSGQREGPEPCLIRLAENAIFKATGRYPLVSISGGTSDGRFFASQSTQVIELGVPNATIHQANECVHLSDLMTLEDIYADMLSQLTEFPSAD